MLTSKLSIRWVLPVAIVLPVFAVSLTLLLLAYETGHRTANDLAAQGTGQIHQRIENHLEHLMDLPAAIDQLNISRLREGTISLDDPARDLSPMFQTLQIFPEISSIVLGCAQGQVTWVIRYPGETSYEYAIRRTPTALMQEYAMSPDGQIGSDPLRTYKFNTVGRPWYRAAVDAGVPTWGNVYVWVRGGKGVTLGVPYVEPIRDEKGNLLGVVNCELTLADISAYLQRLQIGKTGIAFIMERNGNLIASSVPMTYMKNGVDRLPATEAPDPRIVAAARQLAGQPGSLKSIDDVEVDHVDISGEPAQMVVSSFHNRRNLDWLVVTLVPDVDFLADVERARQTATWIGLAAIAVAMALGVALAVWLLNPILAVVAHAKRVGGGDLEARIHRHDNREIEQISDALNEMADGLRDRLRMRHALNLAMDVQQSLLPELTPKISGLDISARSKYCDETGGDYYDYLDVEGMGRNSLMIAMGDVTGHGIAAAMLMATARGVLRAQVRTHGSLGILLTQLNQHLAADTKGLRFMTMFLALVDMSAMSMRWASAGHDHPLIFDPRKGISMEIDAEAGGLPLSVMDDEVYHEYTLNDLRVGQIMLIGTDGLWEAKNNAGEEFGKDRVGEAIAASAHLTAAEIDAEIFKRHNEFCGGRPNADDITYVVIKIKDNAK